MNTMKSPKRDMKLTLTELEQLMEYVMYRERVGWFYGNRSQFEKRHENIKRELEQLLILYGGTPTKTNNQTEV